MSLPSSTTINNRLNRYDGSVFLLPSTKNVRNFFDKTTQRTSINDSLFSQKRRLVIAKTTARFHKNGSLFSQKRQLIFTKTTARFHKNDGSFSQKRRLVFIKAIGSFLSPLRKEQLNIESPKQEMEILGCENTYNHPSRAYAYTRVTGNFIVFAVTSVTHFLVKHSITTFCGYHQNII